MEYFIKEIEERIKVLQKDPTPMNIGGVFELVLIVKRLKALNMRGVGRMCCEEIPKDSFYLGTSCPKCKKPFRIVKQ